MEEPNAVLNTSAWPRMDLDVLDDLHLDSRNVRLDTTDARVEADILRDLFANEDALALVKEITTVGYLTHDVPIALVRRGKYVVVEGNRRIAALKAIQNPQLVPTFKARITELAAGLDDRASLRTVEVLLAPGQVEADQVIAAIHTGSLRRPWGPARQAAFFQAQVDSGKSLRTLLARYPTVDVRLFVLRARILNEFRDATYKDPALRDYVASKEWKRGVSALARIHQSKQFRDLTGFEMDDEGTVTKAISQNAFDEMASVIVAGLRDGRLTTRSLNTVKSPGFTGLMDELRNIAEPGSTPSASKGSSRTGSSASPTISASASGRARSTPSRFLQLEHIQLPGSYPIPLRQMIEELAKLDISKFPNAAYLLTRAILEKTIKAFADDKGERISGKGRSRRVQLKGALDWLHDYVDQNGPKSLKQPIARVRSGGSVYMATNDSMDAVNHNQKFGADPDEVRQLWAKVDEIMKFVIAP